MPAEAKIDIVLRDATGSQPRLSPPAPVATPADRLRPGATTDRPWETPHAPITKVDGRATKVDVALRDAAPPAGGETPARPTRREGQGDDKSFDAYAEARRQIEQDRRRELVQQARDSIQPPKPPPVFNAEAEARRQQEASKRAEEAALFRRAMQQGVSADTLKAREKAGNVGTGLAGAARSAISGDVGGAASRLAELVPATSAAGKALAGIAAPVGMAAAALGVFAFGLKKANDALSERADQLAPYSGQLSVAQAQAEIAQVMNDIRRAQQFGPGLSNYVESASARDQAWSDLTMKIEQSVEGFTSNFNRGLAVIMNWANNNSSMFEPTSAFGLSIGNISKGITVTAQSTAEMAEAMRQQNQQNGLINELQIDSQRVMERTNKLLEDIKEQAKRPRAMGVPRVL